MRLFAAAFPVSLALAFSLACSKKDNDSEGSESDKLVTENLKAPSTLLEKATAALQSATETDMSSTMVSGLALPLTADAISVADCTEHGEAKARSGDDANYVDSSQRLRLAHPRMPFQHLYCQMALNSNAPDTFLGAISSSKAVLCFVEKAINFDNQKHEFTVKSDQVAHCMDDLDDQAKEETKQLLESDLKGTITSSIPSSFGDKDSWTGSIEVKFKNKDFNDTFRLLVKDSDDVFAVALNNGSGRKERVDGFAVSVDKKNGIARYASRFQRIRSADGSSSNGWNRHAVAYVKGKIRKDFTFESVTEAQGAYSDISLNYGTADNATDTTAGVKSGSMWTVKGSENKGFRAHSYDLTCTGADNARTCSSPNLASSWSATAGSNSCGGTTDTSCEEEGIALDSDEKAGFAMDLSHTKFLKTEDWFNSLKVPDFKNVQLESKQ